MLVSLCVQFLFVSSFVTMVNTSFFIFLSIAGKVGKRSKKQYRRDQTERRQKRIERSKAKGASKDVWGLRREGAIVHWSTV